MHSAREFVGCEDFGAVGIGGLWLWNAFGSKDRQGQPREWPLFVAGLSTARNFAGGTFNVLCVFGQCATWSGCRFLNGVAEGVGDVKLFCLDFKPAVCFGVGSSCIFGSPLRSLHWSELLPT